MEPTQQDRQDVLARLNDAVGRGALDVAEYEQRSDLVVQARSRADLAAIVGRLPADPRERDRKELREYLAEWRWWLAGVLVLTGSWMVIGVSRQDFGRFWPAIPLGVWALVLIALPLLPRPDGDEVKPD